MAGRKLIQTGPIPSKRRIQKVSDGTRVRQLDPDGERGASLALRRGWLLGISARQGEPMVVDGPRDGDELPGNSAWNGSLSLLLPAHVSKVRSRARHQIDVGELISDGPHTDAVAENGRLASCGSLAESVEFVPFLDQSGSQYVCVLQSVTRVWSEAWRAGWAAWRSGRLFVWWSRRSQWGPPPWPLPRWWAGQWGREQWAGQWEEGRAVVVDLGSESEQLPVLCTVKERSVRRTWRRGPSDVGEVKSDPDALNTTGIHMMKRRAVASGNYVNGHGANGLTNPLTPSAWNRPRARFWLILMVTTKNGPGFPLPSLNSTEGVGGGKFPTRRIIVSACGSRSRPATSQISRPPSTNSPG